MTVAIHKVHLQKGPWVSDGGYEYNAVLMAAVFAITAAGPARSRSTSAAGDRVGDRAARGGRGRRARDGQALRADDRGGPQTSTGRFTQPAATPETAATA